MAHWTRLLVSGAAALVAVSCSSSGEQGEATTPPPVPVSTLARPVTATVPVTAGAPSTSADIDPEVTTAVTAEVSTTPLPTTTLPPDPPPPNENFVGLVLGADPVVEIELPTAATWHPVDGQLYVSTQDGRVVRASGEAFEVVLDVTAETVEFEPGSERGLLGLAFDPRDGRMFVNFTDLEGHTNVVSFAMVDGVVDLASRREVLFFEQPGLGHNGGRLVFDGSGNLLIGSGDGGGSNGRDAQDTTKLLGALLRITPRLDAEGYDIPPDNPFADGVADRPEIFVRGFRNPWTFSLDDETGDVWIGDVGNEEFEEIDLVPGGTSGQNFGWYWFEGNKQRRSDAPAGMTPPVYDYPRSDGVAVMGGHVYRGSAIPALRGAYLFADLTGPVWAIGASGVTRLEAERVGTIVGWAQDPAGELYLLGHNSGVYRLVQR